MNYENLTLHTDKYQLNMMYAHWIQGTHNNKSVFEIYFRKLPFGNGYAVFAGLERIVHYIQNLKFDDAEIEYLRMQEEQYSDAFLEELRSFRFTGRLDSVTEGTLVFPGEPLIRVEARLFEAHLLETAMLNFMNYQTLIATKASRIKQVAPNDTLLEFGTRRAQERTPPYGEHGPLTSRASTRPRICGQACCSASRPRARTHMPGCRAMIQKKKRSAVMRRRCLTG